MLDIGEEGRMKEALCTDFRMHPYHVEIKLTALMCHIVNANGADTIKSNYILHPLKYQIEFQTF
jgi:hypothetical protein